MHDLMRTTVRRCRVGVVGLAVVAAGCSGPAGSGLDPTGGSVASSVATSATPTAAATTAATRRGDLSPQGFIPKDLGQLAGIDCTGDLDTCAIKFSVDEIEVNPECHQYGAPAVVGRKTLLLHVSMTTGDLSEDGSRMAPSIFNPFSLNGIADDGFVQEGRPGSCSDQDSRLSDTILPNSRYVGIVEVEVAEGATSVASAYPVASNGSRGWVWRIG
jgi:hypothetical protein